MRLFQRWSFIFTLSVFIIFSFLFSVLHNDLKSLPSENWSRAVEISSSDSGSKFSDYYKKSTLITSDSDQNFYIFTNKNKVLDSLIFDNNFNEISNTSVNIDSEISNINGFIENGKLFAIYNNDISDNFYNLIYDISSSTAEKNESFMETDSINSFIGRDFVLFEKEGELFLNDGLSSLLIAKEKFIENFTASSDNQNNYISYTFFDGNQYVQNLITFDKNTHNIVDTEIYKFPYLPSSAPTEFVSELIDNTIYTANVIKDSKSGLNKVYLLSKDLYKNDSVIYNKSINSSTYSVNPSIYKTDEGIKVSISSETNIGRTDFGADEEYVNIISHDFYEDDTKVLTKSKFPSMNPIFIAYDNDVYLFHNEINKSKNTLYVSSNNDNLINSSQIITKNEFKDLLFTTATSFLPLSYLGFILDIVILTPIIAVVIVVSMFYITWAEKNGNKLIAASVIIYILMKNYLLYSFFFTVSKNYAKLPNFLDTPLEFFGLGLFFTAVPLYCLYDYNKTHSHSHFLAKYMFFNGLDIILVIMLYTPYVFIY